MQFILDLPHYLLNIITIIFNDIITITNTNTNIIILTAVSFMFPCWRCFMSVAISSEEADCALMFNTVSTDPPPRLGKKQQKAQQDYYLQ